ncbi:MAG: peptidoglycan-associated lipoprotein Pal [Micavibrio aeruginosavorus]|uniref:Peptidoglycan-associated lipoprotein n=1 Tax=Micavibrio aeruginosavorus TaxID=349221 RepID=A0A7T5R3U7_9BACT|nr:MAG: peptidoglycan-associated lipoprotein Pal [Micavibrio aeruginosavorus]
MLFIRGLLMMAVVVSLGACSTKDKDADSVQVTDGGMAAGPLDGTETYGTAGADGVVPGTQQDLVVNVGDRVFFGYDRYDVSPEGQRVLEMQAEWLKRYPNNNVTIKGHCDERGTREYNLALGERRASAIKNYLVALGIPATRINTISYGKEQPAVMGSNEDAWAQNRRGVTEVD